MDSLESNRQFDSKPSLEDIRNPQNEKPATVAVAGAKTAKVKDRGGLTTIQMQHEFDKHGQPKR